jgi:hypothetical protein
MGDAARRTSIDDAAHQLGAKLAVKEPVLKNVSYGVFSSNSVWCSPKSVSGLLDYLVWDSEEILRDSEGVEYNRSDETAAVQGFTYQDRINEDILTRHLLDVDLDPALTERYDLRHRSLWEPTALPVEDASGESVDGSADAREGAERDGEDETASVQLPAEESNDFDHDGQSTMASALKASMHTESTMDPLFQSDWMNTSLASEDDSASPLLEQSFQRRQPSLVPKVPSKPTWHAAKLPSFEGLSFDHTDSLFDTTSLQRSYEDAYFLNSPLNTRFSRRPVRVPPCFTARRKPPMKPAPRAAAPLVPSKPVARKPKVPVGESKGGRWGPRAPLRTNIEFENVRVGAGREGVCLYDNRSPRDPAQRKVLLVTIDGDGEQGEVFHEAYEDAKRAGLFALSNATCPFCHETPVEPVMLRCGHQFCDAHLGDVLQRVQVPGSEEAVRGLSGQGEGVICPLCGDIHLYSKVAMHSRDSTAYMGPIRRDYPSAIHVPKRPWDIVPHSAT